MAILETQDVYAPRGASLRDWARIAGLAYGLSGFVLMWGVWTYLVVFLANAPRLRAPWVSPSVDVGATLDRPLGAALVNAGLIALFGLQHSLMARPGLKKWWADRMHPAFVRATYVHAANAALIVLVLLWQPLPAVLWHVDEPIVRGSLWALFALGWVILFAGAWSFGLYDLLGVTHIRCWFEGRPLPPMRLKTGRLYTWMRHPMYVGLMLGVWATPHMTAGHALLAAGFTLYIAIGMRYEQRDLQRSFGAAYRRWCGQ